MKIASKNLIKNRLKLRLKKYREEDSLFIVEGFHLIEEALKSGLVIEIFSTKNFFEFENTFIVEEKIIEQFSSTKSPQKAIAICKKIHFEDREYNKILLLNKLNDPGNLGTLIRTAHAFDFDAVFVDGVDFYNPKVLRSSQGSFFHVPCININDSYEFLKSKKEHQVIGAILDENASNFKDINVEEKVILVLGNEANGIEKKNYKLIKNKTYIPIKFESLNVAQAGAILMNYIFSYKK